VRSPNDQLSSKWRRGEAVYVSSTHFLTLPTSHSTYIPAGVAYTGGTSWKLVSVLCVCVCVCELLQFALELICRVVAWSWSGALVHIPERPCARIFRIKDRETLRHNTYSVCLYQWECIWGGKSLWHLEVSYSLTWISSKHKKTSENMMGIKYLGLRAFLSQRQARQ
jgi:hypothetical protein